MNMHITVKPVLSGQSKIDKTRVLNTNGSLMKVESIADCSSDTFYLHHQSCKPIFGLFEWPFKAGFTVVGSTVFHNFTFLSNLLSCL